jgi:hypothetical protein
MNKVRKNFLINKNLVEKLQSEKNKSELINDLLSRYFENKSEIEIETNTLFSNIESAIISIQKSFSNFEIVIKNLQEKITNVETKNDNYKKIEDAKFKFIDEKINTIIPNVKKSLEFLDKDLRLNAMGFNTLYANNYLSKDERNKMNDNLIRMINIVSTFLQNNKIN